MRSLQQLLLLMVLLGTLLLFQVQSEEEVVAEEEEHEPDFTPEAQADLVTELPGMRSLGKRRMYSGYIPVEGEGRGTMNFFLSSYILQHQSNFVVLVII